MIEVQIFLDAEDRYNGQPMHEHILRFLMHHKIAGATLIRGMMGFGSHHHLQEPTRLGAADAVPLIVVFVDDEEKVAAVLPHVKQVVSEGLIVTHRVERF